MSGTERLDYLLNLAPVMRKAALDRMSDRQLRALGTHWRLMARPEQLAPEGDWRIWLILAGRGFGKTRAGAEWVREVVKTECTARIALVAASLAEARTVMVEGKSGILAVSPQWQRPDYEPSLRRLIWPNGAIATIYSAGEPQSLRGPQHSHASGPGPKGDLRQRSARSCRRPAALRRRGRGLDAACRSGRRRGLGGRSGPRRRVDRTTRQACVSAGGQLAVRRSARRDASAEPRHRSGAPLPWPCRRCRPVAARSTSKRAPPSPPWFPRSAKRASFRKNRAVARSTHFVALGCRFEPRSCCNPPLSRYFCNSSRLLKLAPPHPGL